MSKCQTCGSNNNNTAKFCCECGKSLEVNQQKDNDPIASTLSEGHILKGRYVIKRLIKIGGMGAVYEAEDKETNKNRAIKELWSYWITSDQEKEYVIKKFDFEAKLLAELKHKNLPSVSDYFIDGERYYLVMDFIDGHDLDTVIKEEGNPGLPYKQVIKWAIQLCELLDYLHSYNPCIIYRDLKPSNIMIRNQDKSLFLIDFGIACSIQEDNSGTPRTQIGTMGYIAPEQYLGKPVPQSDLYSLGATMYHLLTGNMPLPFVYNPMSSIIPDISHELDEIVRRSLDLKVDERFPSAKEMKKFLEKLLKPKRTSSRKLKAEDFWIGHLTSVEDKNLKITAINTLGDLSAQKAVPLLSSILLNEEEASFRRVAAYSLGKIGDPEAIDALITKVDDPDLEVTLACIESLSNFNEERVLNCLVGCLYNENKTISQYTAKTLQNMGYEDLLKNKDTKIIATNEKTLLKEKEKDYSNLIAELLDKDYGALISLIKINMDKFDEGFFNYFDFRLQQSMIDKDKQKYNELSYLSKILDNLNIKKSYNTGPLPEIPEFLIEEASSEITFEEQPLVEEDLMKEEGFDDDNLLQNFDNTLSFDQIEPSSFNMDNSVQSYLENENSVDFLNQEEDSNISMAENEINNKDFSLDNIFELDLNSEITNREYMQENYMDNMLTNSFQPDFTHQEIDFSSISDFLSSDRGTSEIDITTVHEVNLPEDFTDINIPEEISSSLEIKDEKLYDTQVPDIFPEEPEIFKEPENISPVETGNGEMYVKLKEEIPPPEKIKTSEDYGIKLLDISPEVSTAEAEQLPPVEANTEDYKEKAFSHYSNARELIDHGKFQEAVEECEKAVTYEPEFIDVYYTLGNIYKKVNRPDLAVESYKKYLSLKQKISASIAKTNVKYKQEKQVKSPETVKKDIITDKVSPQKITPAEKKTPTESPEKLRERISIAQDLTRKAKYNLAIEEYKNILKNNPLLSEAYSELGNIYKRTGKFDLAIDNFNSYLKIVPDDNVIHFEIGLLYKIQGNKEASIKHFTRCQEISPSSSQASRAKKYIKDLQKI